METRDLLFTELIQNVHPDLQTASEMTWSSIRSDYVLLCELVEKVDHELRFLILMSNLNNLYFICYQLLNIFT